MHPYTIPDADLRFDPHWLARAEADALLDRLMDEVRWVGSPGTELEFAL